MKSKEGDWRWINAKKQASKQKPRTTVLQHFLQTLNVNAGKLIFCKAVFGLNTGNIHFLILSRKSLTFNQLYPLCFFFPLCFFLSSNPLCLNNCYLALNINDVHGYFLQSAGEIRLNISAFLLSSPPSLCFLRLQAV